MGVILCGFFLGGGGGVVCNGPQLVTVQVRLSDRVVAMFYLVEDLT